MPKKQYKPRQAKQACPYNRPEGKWTRQQAADYLKLSASSLAKLQAREILKGKQYEGGGGAVYYNPADVIEFEKKR